MKSYAEQLAYLDRMKAKQSQAHAKAIAAKSLTRDKADHDRECLEAVLFTVQKVKDLADISEEMKAEAMKEAA